MKLLIRIGIGTLIVGGVFAFLWWKGYLDRLTNYLVSTREELRKCTWPTTEELKGSTVVVAIAILLLGVFTMSADFIIVTLLDQILRLAA